MKDKGYYFKLGYEQQCWGYPILDHVWDRDDELFPKKFQESYRQGQIQAHEDGEAECPWFYNPNTKTIFR